MTNSPRGPGERDSFPEKMKFYDQWVVWKLIKKPNKPKPDKIPVNPASHEFASVSDPRTWGSYEDAQATLKSFPTEYEGIGFVITEDDPFVFIDLDSVKDGTGWKPLVAETLKKVPSWAEFSQSGEGIHIIAESSGTTVKTKGIEVYQYGRFVALTGRRIPDTPADTMNCQDGVDWLRQYARDQGGDEVKPAAPAPVDARLAAFDRLNMEYTFKQSGKAEMRCPWGHEHGNGDPYGAVYMPAHYNGRASAAFFCQHATCQSAGRSNLSALDVWLRSADPEYHGDTLRDAFQDVPITVDMPTGQQPLFVSAQTGLDNMNVAPKWIVKGLMEACQVGVLYGPSQTFKTYISLDLALHVAAGKDWQGFSTKRKGDVYYLAGEGNSGLWQRLQAAMLHHRISRDMFADNLFLSTRGLNLMDDQHMLQLAEIATARGRTPEVLIIDTLSRNAILEENSAKDMSDLVSRCTMISLAWKCAVLIIHHTGKNKADTRGSSALTANTDFRCKLDRFDRGPTLITQMTIEKLKNAPEPPDPIPFEAHRKVLIGFTDEDGNTLTDIAFSRIEQQHDNVNVRSQVKLTKKQTALLSFVIEFMNGVRGLGAMAGVRRHDIWEGYEAHCKENGMTPHKQNFQRMLSRLVEAGEVKIDDQDDDGAWYYLPAK